MRPRRFILLAPPKHDPGGSEAHDFHQVGGGGYFLVTAFAVRQGPDRRVAFMDHHLGRSRAFCPRVGLRADLP